MKRQDTLDSAKAAFDHKVDRAIQNKLDHETGQTTNTDETLEIDRSGVQHIYGAFTKNMPHNAKGEATVEDYKKLTFALLTGKEDDFNAIVMAGGRKLVSPQAALAFSTIGADSHSLTMPAPPSITSRAGAAEMVEVYEHALNRDTPFHTIEDSAPNTDADRAVASLNAFGVDFLGPKDTGAVTRKTLFRGAAVGCDLGPYISQFLYQPVPYGASLITQKYKTETSVDYGTTVSDFLDIQNGTVYDPDAGLSVEKFLYTPRVLGSYVHRDAAFQAYYNAALILLANGAALDPNNPYVDGSLTSGAGFVTHGGADILCHVTGVCAWALRAAWHQKWNVHRKIRPEAMANLCHLQESGDTAYGLHADLISSATVTAVKNFNTSGTALLPLQYPEGSPGHPSYPAGHAVVAGAAVTILKAFFDESTPITSLFSVMHSEDGDSLVAYPNSTAGMTVGTELNKIAANVAIGRDFAGVHYRADGDWGMDLGEKVAIAYLKDLKATYNEDFAGWNLTKFDGTPIVIS
jgi:hypothetical protein